MSKFPTFDVLQHPLAGTHLVEASAGTGKTFNITTLVLRLLLERGLGIEEILVVTFTKAATAELRGRVRTRIREALDGFEQGTTTDPVLQALVEAHPQEHGVACLGAALARFDGAAIYTIHSFCQRALVAFAFESGEPFSVDFGEDASELYAELCQDHWAARAYEADPGWLASVADVFSGPGSLTDLAKHAVERPDLQVLPLADDEEEELIALQRELFDVARRRLDEGKETRNQRSFSDLLVRLSEALDAPGGQALADAIFERYPAALIDEFQDTDPIQFTVFQRAFAKNRGTLFLIGDPKQAIYAFRGGDIYAYLRAVKGTPPSTLGVNYRSDDALVQALGALYGRGTLPFVDARIPFHEVTAHEGARMKGPTGASAPLQVKMIRKEGKGKRNVTATWAKTGLPPLIAADIVRFLQSDALLHRGLDAQGKPIWSSPRPSDVAVLVRRNADATEVQEALLALGVHSVVSTDRSVFESDEADDLWSVLQAVLRPTSDRLLRVAVTTRLVGMSANRLAEVVADDAAWADWAQRVRGWRDTWERRGFAAMFRLLLLETLDEGVLPAQERILGLPRGERRMTNLLHLAELLSQESQRRSLGPVGASGWFAERRAGQGDGADDEELRLESDSDAATIMTVYKAKGLQFPVVWVPYGHITFKVDQTRPLFHGAPPEEAATLSLDPKAWGRHSKQAGFEQFAQERRVLYVSLTRAAHRVTVFWGEWYAGEKCALAALLHPPSGLSDADSPEVVLEAAQKHVKAMKEEARMADLLSFASGAPGLVEVDWLDETPVAPLERAEAQEEMAAQAAFGGRIRTSWRRSSYSGMVRDRGQSVSHPDPTDRDEQDEESGEGVDEPAVDLQPADASDCGFLQFPRGARAGVVLHAVFEHLDFQGDEAHITAVVMAQLAQARLDAADLGPGTTAAVQAVLSTPLGGSLEGFTLADLPRERRLDELGFLFPVSHRGPDAPNLGQSKLAEFLRQQGEGGLARRVEGLGFGRLRGHLNGFIDLVFEQAGRFWVVDYKSNFLGPTLGDYHRQAMEGQVAHHHYDLQYLVYAVALHRHLCARLPGYRFGDHFGGVRYLFVRGMHPETGAERGVFSAQPTEALVGGLSDLFREPGGTK